MILFLVQEILPNIASNGSLGTMLWSHNSNNGSPYVAIYNNKLSFGRTNAYPIISGVTNVNLNTWYYFTITRESGVIKVFLNGVLESTLSDTTNYNISNNITIFSNLPLDNNWTGAGYLDDIRVTKGVARYSSSFTPPIIELGL